MQQGICPVCGSKSDIQKNNDIDSIFYICPVCGRYEITYTGSNLQEYPKLAHYLFHNRFLSNYFEYRYHTTRSKEQCDTYRAEFDAGNNTHGRPVHMDETIIQNWYPKTLSDRIDRILLKINELSVHIGQQVTVEYPALLSLLFIDRKEKDKFWQSFHDRESDDCYKEAQYMVNVLKDNGFVQVHTKGMSITEGVHFVLTPAGYARVDELQKNSSYGHQALVAMAFNDETKQLRESIRKGIQDAGYAAIFIDEVQHNDFITPELLKHIRDSRFVVADLTHKNNGAYFEEGYAMGLGKPVIQLCKKGITLHFDIAQKNTIMWDTEDDIPERLTNRIKATID